MAYCTILFPMYTYTRRDASRTLELISLKTRGCQQETGMCTKKRPLKMQMMENTFPHPIQSL